MDKNVCGTRTIEGSIGSTESTGSTGTTDIGPVRIAWITLNVDFATWDSDAFRIVLAITILEIPLNNVIIQYFR